MQRLTGVNAGNITQQYKDQTDINAGNFLLG